MKSSVTVRFVSLLMAVLGSAVAMFADVIPPGLNPGDQYRLIFITSVPITDTSDNIADYDAFVNQVANAPTSELQSLGATWQAIVSTSTESAATHLGASSVPIYRLDGQKLANGTTGPDGLWSPSGLLDPDPTSSGVLFDERGDNAQTTPTIQLVWTGTAADGSALNPLGTGPNFEVGCTIVADSRWIEFQPFGSSSKELPVYGISSVLTVPLPEPGALGALLPGALLLLGCACFPRLRNRSCSR